jgi:hypothetical protein
MPGVIIVLSLGVEMISSKVPKRVRNVEELYFQK